MKKFRKLNPVKCKIIIIACYRMIMNGRDYMVKDTIKDFVERSIDFERKDEA